MNKHTPEWHKEYENWCKFKSLNEALDEPNKKTDVAYVSWIAVDYLIHTLADKIQASNRKYDYVVGVSRGGLVPAVMLSHALNIPIRSMMPDDILQPTHAYLIVDEIYDTGKTMQKIIEQNSLADTAVLYHNLELDPLTYFGVKTKLDKWLIFPWEKK